MTMGLFNVAVHSQFEYFMPPQINIIPGRWNFFFRMVTSERSCRWFEPHCYWMAFNIYSKRSTYHNLRHRTCHDFYFELFITRHGMQFHTQFSSKFNKTLSSEHDIANVVTTIVDLKSPLSLLRLIERWN